MNEIWISLTTLPDRIYKINKTLNSLKNQTVQVDKINLCIPYIAKRLNKPYIIPNFLINDKHINIIRCEDYGPITKLLGSLNNCENPNTIIITVDDDVIYPTDLVEKLLTRSQLYPKSAIGFCGWMLKDLVKSKHYFYSNLVYEDRIKGLKFKTSVDVLEGYRGVLYKKHFFDNKIYDITNLDESIFYVDDTFISLLLSENNVDRLSFKYEEDTTLTTDEIFNKIWKCGNKEKDSLSSLGDFYEKNVDAVTSIIKKYPKLKWKHHLY